MCFSVAAAVSYAQAIIPVSREYHAQALSNGISHTPPDAIYTNEPGRFTHSALADDGNIRARAFFGSSIPDEPGWLFGYDGGASVIVSGPGTASASGSMKLVFDITQPLMVEEQIFIFGDTNHTFKMSSQNLGVMRTSLVQGTHIFTFQPDRYTIEFSASAFFPHNAPRSMSFTASYRQVPEPGCIALCVASVLTLATRFGRRKRD